MGDVYGKLKHDRVLFKKMFPSGLTSGRSPALSGNWEALPGCCRQSAIVNVVCSHAAILLYTQIQPDEGKYLSKLN